MPILHNKLVMKSIEALHDEALALMPDTASNRDVASPPAVLRAATPPHEAPIDALKNTSANTLPETASDHDIMARIDHLLKRLDEDDVVAIAPQVKKGAEPKAENIMGEPGDSGADDAGDNKFSDDQQDETEPTEQTQTLADIAEAIYEARQQAIGGVATDAGQNTTNQNSTTHFDMDVISATVADEVRRTVSAVMITELPQVIRNAVGEAIRALPANTPNPSTPATENPSAANSVTARKTATIRKSGSKKTRTNKTVAEKASRKTIPKRRLKVEKTKPKKRGAKKTTDKKTASPT